MPAGTDQAQAQPLPQQQGTGTSTRKRQAQARAEAQVCLVSVLVGGSTPPNTTMQDILEEQMQHGCNRWRVR
eukprot:15479005-Alexandrium_andersonii.AAC.1